MRAPAKYFHFNAIFAGASITFMELPRIMLTYGCAIITQYIMCTIVEVVFTVMLLHHGHWTIVVCFTRVWQYVCAYMAFVYTMNHACLISNFDWSNCVNMRKKTWSWQWHVHIVTSAKALHSIVIYIYAHALLVTVKHDLRYISYAQIFVVQKFLWISWFKLPFMKSFILLIFQQLLQNCNNGCQTSLIIPLAPFCRPCIGYIEVQIWTTLH